MAGETLTELAFSLSLAHELRKGADVVVHGCRHGFVVDEFAFAAGSSA